MVVLHQNSQATLLPPLSPSLTVRMSVTELVRPCMDEDPEELGLNCTSDILQSHFKLQQESSKNKEKLYEFILNAARNNEEEDGKVISAQIMAAKFALEHYHQFPEYHTEANEIVYHLLEKTDLSLRLTILNQLSVLSTKGVGQTEKITDILLQLVSSTIQDEKDQAYDQLVQVMGEYPNDLALQIKKYLRKEPNERKRKAIFEFMRGRMRCVQLHTLKDEEFIATLEETFREELTERVSISYIDDMIAYIGGSLIMDSYERQQSIATWYIENFEVPEALPYFDEELVDDTDLFLVRITIVRHMCTVLRSKSNKVNEIFAFLVNNLSGIREYDMNRKIRAHRALADIASVCSNMLDDSVVDRLIQFIEVMIPVVDDPHAKIVPKVNFVELEPLMLSLHRIKDVPYMAEKLTDNDSDRFKNKVRRLIRCCQLKSTEFKTVAEELNFAEVPLRKELNYDLYASTTTGLLCLEFLKPIEQWSCKPKPSWKSIFNPRPPAKEAMTLVIKH